MSLGRDRGSGPCMSLLCYATIIYTHCKQLSKISELAMSDSEDSLADPSTDHSYHARSARRPAASLATSAFDGMIYIEKCLVF